MAGLHTCERKYEHLGAIDKSSVFMRYSAKQGESPIGLWLSTLGGEGAVHLLNGYSDARAIVATAAVTHDQYLENLLCIWMSHGGLQTSTRGDTRCLAASIPRMDMLASVVVRRSRRRPTPLAKSDSRSLVPRRESEMRCDCCTYAT